MLLDCFYIFQNFVILEESERPRDHVGAFYYLWPEFETRPHTWVEICRSKTDSEGFSPGTRVSSLSKIGSQLIFHLAFMLSSKFTYGSYSGCYCVCCVSCQMCLGRTPKMLWLPNLPVQSPLKQLYWGKETVVLCSDFCRLVIWELKRS